MRNTENSFKNYLKFLERIRPSRKIFTLEKNFKGTLVIRNFTR